MLRRAAATRLMAGTRHHNCSVNAHRLYLPRHGSEAPMLQRNLTTATITLPRPSRSIIRVQRRGLSFLPPKAFLSAGKVFSRLAVTTGGAAAASITYYQNKLSAWADEMHEDAAEWYGWFRSLDLPNFSDFQLPFNLDAADSNERESRSRPPDGGETVAPVVHDDSGDDDEDDLAPPQFSEPKNTADSHFMALTRRLIEVKNILRPVGHADTLKLPALVVIGSQSSGKSSLLEALVGQEFLPKGVNMVTRRPIEVTLVYTPDSREEYADFPAQGVHHIKDFSKVQQLLADLNRTVSDAECVSAEPIDLRIYSPNVPDLTLIDLPGYIALNTRNQPPELKEKIVSLCRQYIAEPNIILAVSAADVDLANSEALNEARRADPLAVRTVGILTKIDLVAPERGAALLSNEEYPLHLGYWGVICKQMNSSTSVVSANNPGNKYKRVQAAEEEYFRDNATVFTPVGAQLGVRTLRRSLMQVLETKMTQSLRGIVDTVQSELEEARYHFKVHFNDRMITPEAYVTDVMEGMKGVFRQVSQRYGRPALRSAIQHLLDERAAQLCDSMYWQPIPSGQGLHGDLSTKPSRAWTEQELQHWTATLDRAHSLFTKSGLGKQATQAVVDTITQSLLAGLQVEPFQHHVAASSKIMALAEDLLKSKLYQTVEQVENSIKPYKFDFDFTEQEWNDGLARAMKMVQTQLAATKVQFEEIRGTLGRRNLRSALQYIDDLERRKERAADKDNALAASEAAKSPLTPPVPPRMLAKAYEAWQMQKKMNLLDRRLATLRPGWFSQSDCSAAHEFKKAVETVTASSSKASNVQHSCRAACPEVYLMVVSAKLAQSAMMFVWIELVNEFYYLFPRELDHQIYYSMRGEQFEEFARENPLVSEHLTVQARKQALETAMDYLSAGIWEATALK